VEVHILTEMERNSKFFQGFNLVFVHREANKVAHICALHSLSQDAPLSSFDVCPGFLDEVVHLEFVSDMEIKSLRSKFEKNGYT
jgi:hypothetical protein